MKRKLSLKSSGRSPGSRSTASIASLTPRLRTSDTGGANTTSSGGLQGGIKWTTISDPISPTGLCPNGGLNYGNRPWKPNEIRSESFQDNWLRYQAKSITGRDHTLAEALDFFQVFDLTTRRYKNG